MFASYTDARLVSSFQLICRGQCLPSANSSESGSVDLPAGLQRELMPRHVAVIMDGHRRWARMKGVPLGSGYEAGGRALRRIVDLCCELGISVLTVFAFSRENYRLRPDEEKKFLMALFERGLRGQLQHLHSAGVRVSFIGDFPKLLETSDAVSVAHEMESTTVSNSRLHLIMAINYSGQSDIVHACHKLALQVKGGAIEPDDINGLLVERQLETNCIDFPSTDLLIRTSGEVRISNFSLWQLAFTELYFAEQHWPDFGDDEFLKAFGSFQKRQRRFGGQS